MLQTLSKCLSTNLESFTFRLLTQPTQGIFLRYAIVVSLFDAYFVEKKRIIKENRLVMSPSSLNVNYPKIILRNNTNFSHQHYKLYSQKALRHSDENQTVATLFSFLYSSPIIRTSGSNVTANFSLITV